MVATSAVATRDRLAASPAYRLSSAAARWHRRIARFWAMTAPAWSELVMSARPALAIPASASARHPARRLACGDQDVGRLCLDQACRDRAAYRQALHLHLRQWLAVRGLHQK